MGTVTRLTFNSLKTHFTRSFSYVFMYFQSKKENKTIGWSYITVMNNFNVLLVAKCSKVGGTVSL